MTLPDGFHFSQSSLHDYQTCARRFELRYIQQRRWPAVESEPVREYEQHMQRGTDFHQLVQRHALGIPAETLAAGIRDDDLRRWWQAYLASGYAAGDESRLPGPRWPEVTLTAPLAGYRLLAQYDLLAVEPGGPAVIVDWKTNTRKPSREWLAEHPQTRVYRYLLVEAGAHLNGGQPIEPEQVNMVYWFAAAPDKVEAFSYDAGQHKATGDELANLITEIAERTDFDLVADVAPCRFCTYRSLCERGESAADFRVDDGAAIDRHDESPLRLDFDLDQVAEVEF